MSELKRCPFCGGEIKLMFLNCETFEDIVWDESIGNVPTWFKCYGCDSEFFHDEPIDIPEKQIEWWNTRKPVERLVERLEEQKAFENVWDDEASCGAYNAYHHAIEIVKEEGGMND